MKSTSIIAALAILSTVFSVAAQAQTGRPATVEVAAAADTPRVAAADADADVGSYARYLMLNGATREQAVAAARNIDHPAARKVVTTRAHASESARQ